MTGVWNATQKLEALLLSCVLVATGAMGIVAVQIAAPSDTGRVCHAWAKTQRATGWYAIKKPFSKNVKIKLTGSSLTIADKMRRSSTEFGSSKNLSGSSHKFKLAKKVNWEFSGSNTGGEVIKTSSFAKAKNIIKKRLLASGTLANGKVDKWSTYMEIKVKNGKATFVYMGAVPNYRFG